MEITKADLLERIEALENENKQRGIGNQFMTLKCIQGNRHFTKDATYCASKLFDRTVITTNFGSRKELTVNTNIFGGYKVTGENQTAVFQVIGADVETEPQLKQLDQSIFNGLDEKWRFAAVNSSGDGYKYTHKPRLTQLHHMVTGGEWSPLGQYDTSNWQNSLIERDIAKELLEVDLSSELTGSDLARAMLARGDKYILCLVGDGGDYRVANQGYAFIVTGVHSNGEFDTPVYTWEFAVPINNQGEPLTASEVGL